ncbi:MAG TPA: hypothetical protein VK141_06105 [Nitrosomonas sp.]|nr:hypothetical protein [Nitrosomonas sp.]
MGISLKANDVSAAGMIVTMLLHLYIHDAMNNGASQHHHDASINFLCIRLAGFLAGLQRSRTAHDAQDILIEDTGLNAINIPNQHDEAYRCYPRLSGAVALTSAVLPSNYLNTFMDKQILSRQYSIDELLDF